VRHRRFAANAEVRDVAATRTRRYRAGDPGAARESYLRAARMTASLPEQHYLTRRAARLGRPGDELGT
jgi:hypothetical protein